MKDHTMSYEEPDPSKDIALELFNVQLAIDKQEILQALTFDLAEGEILFLNKRSTNHLKIALLVLSFKIMRYFRTCQLAKISPTDYHT